MRLVARLFFLFLLLFIGTWLLLARPFVINGKSHSDILKADPSLLKSYTKKLSEDFFPRDYLHVENLNRAADWIAEEFRRNNQKVSFQNYKVDGFEYKNVVSEYIPSAESSYETIVVGAHYDSCDELPAADDNASGVAGLLELSRLIALGPVPYKIILVAYPLEEPPYFRTQNMGSAMHAGSLLKSGEKVKLMISLEMIGYFSDEPNSQSHPLSFLNLFYPSTGNFIAIVGPMNWSRATLDLKSAFLRSTQLPAFSINTPSLIPGIDFSDHRNYWDAGFDAVMVTDTAFYRNEAYHTADDTPDRLDYKRMSEVVTGVYAYLLHGS